MAQLSLKEAAHEIGVNKTTVLRAIKSGRLSATRNEDGSYSIDPAELFRVYERNTSASMQAVEKHQRAQAGATPTQSDAGPMRPAASEPDAALQAQLDALREMLKRADKQVEDLREDRDHWRAQAEQSTRLLTHQATTTPASVPSWWRRLVG